MRKDQPKIHIAILAFGEKSSLAQTLDSLLSQQCQNLQVSIIDYVSTKESRSVTSQFDRYCEITEINKSEQLFAGVQSTLSKSDADIMSWTAAEVSYHKQSLEAVNLVFSAHKQIDWITSRSNGCNSEGELTWINCRAEWYCQQFLLKHNYMSPFIHQENVFWRRSLWEKAGGYFDTSFACAADLDLWLRFFRHAQLHTINFLLASKIDGYQGFWERDFVRYSQEAKLLIARENERSMLDPFLRQPPPPTLGKM